MYCSARGGAQISVRAQRKRRTIRFSPRTSLSRSPTMAQSRQVDAKCIEELDRRKCFQIATRDVFLTNRTSRKHAACYAEVGTLAAAFALKTEKCLPDSGSETWHLKRKDICTENLLDDERKSDAVLRLDHIEDARVKETLWTYGGRTDVTGMRRLYFYGCGQDGVVHLIQAFQSLQYVQMSLPLPTQLHNNSQILCSTFEINMQLSAKRSTMTCN